MRGTGSVGKVAIPWWPRFGSAVRSLGVTARLGRALGICLAICFVTGMISHYEYHPWHWLPIPAIPVWGYRLTQGVHVITGIATIPLLLVKLWSVYPRLFRRPLVRGLVQAVERLSIAVLVASALVELTTGFLNAMDWYVFHWPFVPVHRFLAYVLIGSVLVHVAVKLPDIRRGLALPVAAGPPLTEDDRPTETNTPETPATSGLSRRGLLVATGAGVATIVATTVGQTLTPLRRIGLLTIRQTDAGPQGVPVNKTAAQAHVGRVGDDYRLRVSGPHPFELSLPEILADAEHEASLPIACVEGWSVGADWRGMRLLDVVERAGGTASSAVRVTSLQAHGGYRASYVTGPQLGAALLATHLNGTRLDLDHGYPLRLIAPDRPGVQNTKWLATVEVLS